MHGFESPLQQNYLFIFLLKWGLSFGPTEVSGSLPLNPSLALVQKYKAEAWHFIIRDVNGTDMGWNSGLDLDLDLTWILSFGSRPDND